MLLIAPIAQLDRASDYESAGRGFESSWARFEIKGFVKDWIDVSRRVLLTTFHFRGLALS